MTLALLACLFCYLSRKKRKEDELLEEAKNRNNVKKRENRNNVKKRENRNNVKKRENRNNVKKRAEEREKYINDLRARIFITIQHLVSEISDEKDNNIIKQNKHRYMASLDSYKKELTELNVTVANSSESLYEFMKKTINEHIETTIKHNKNIENIENIGRKDKRTCEIRLKMLNEYKKLLLLFDKTSEETEDTIKQKGNYCRAILESFRKEITELKVTVRNSSECFYKNMQDKIKKQIERLLREKKRLIYIKDTKIILQNNMENDENESVKLCREYNYDDSIVIDILEGDFAGKYRLKIYPEYNETNKTYSHKIKKHALFKVEPGTDYSGWKQMWISLNILKKIL
jgi:hypothetical protein